jgi:hypothetical protein
LTKYLEENGISDVNELVGAAHDEPRAIADVPQADVAKAGVPQTVVA